MRSQSQSSGFRASIECASLADLIQMACASGLCSTYRIVTANDEGFLFFDRGAIVHAHTKHVHGEAAAFEILGWCGGVVEPSHERREPTIHLSAQELLLRAAQQNDEDSRDDMVAIRDDELDFDVDADLQFDEGELEDDPPVQASSPEPLDDGDDGDDDDAELPSVTRLDDARGELEFRTLAQDEAFSDVAIIDGRGELVFSDSHDDDELGAVAAYAVQLCEVLADALGLEPFQGLDAALDGGECIVRRLSEERVGIAMGLVGASQRASWNG